MPDHVREDPADVGISAVNSGVVGAQIFDHLPLGSALIIGFIGKCNRKCAKRGVRIFLDQGRYHGRIDPTAQIRPHGNIGPELEPRRIDQELPELLAVFLLGPDASVSLKIQVPVPCSCDLPFFDLQVMSRGQFKNVLECGPRRNGHPESECLVKGIRVQCSRYPAVHEQGLHFGGKEKRPVNDRIEQWPYPDAVPRYKKRLFLFVPYGEGELTVQMGDTICSMIFIQVNDHFGIGHRVEPVAFFLEIPSQLLVIEDHAVRDCPNSLVLVMDRLPATIQVDDAQPRVRETGPIIAIEPEAVRAAMLYHRDHPLERIEGYLLVSVEIKYAGYATHCFPACSRYQATVSVSPLLISNFLLYPRYFCAFHVSPTESLISPILAGLNTISDFDPVISIIVEANSRMLVCSPLATLNTVLEILSPVNAFRFAFTTSSI